ncbi:MAG TPA: hypothetical protein PJ991_08420 [Kiritimatiellia bacterium]|nr:hypothetical protein [Kiritimatiellia bacterium]
MNDNTAGKSEWEATLRELTKLAEKFPSRKLYEQIAECYRQLDEHQEAVLIMDMARYLPAENAGMTEQHV